MVAEPLSVVLLPSMRFGRLYSKQADGKACYLTTEGQLVCEHGELSSTISFWTSLEKRARADGLDPPPRGGFNSPSMCDCQTTEGLNVQVPEDVLLPAKPDSLFEFLEVTNTETIKVKGREARLIPHVRGPAFVSTVGTVTCRHGASRRSLIKKERATAESTRLPKCGCKLGQLSMNGGLKSLQLGKFAKLKVQA
jgi:hypothetical protein